MIEIDRITKTYGDIRAVDSVSMTVETGTITVIVGTSGSGKTTLLRMINRLEEPTSGEVRINGDSTLSVKPYPAAAHRLCHSRPRAVPAS